MHNSFWDTLYESAIIRYMSQHHQLTLINDPLSVMSQHQLILINYLLFESATANTHQLSIIRYIIHHQLILIDYPLYESALANTHPVSVI